jgi:hypothetical protein
MPMDLSWDAWELAGEIQIGTNLDFPAIQSELAQRGIAPEQGATVAHLLAHYAEAYIDAYTASQLNADVRTGVFTAPMMERRFENLMSRVTGSAQNVIRFNEAVLSDARAIAIAIDEGRLAISDLIAVLERGHRFRTWIAEKPFDADLLAAYYRETIATTVAAELPTRSARFVQATVADVEVINRSLTGKYGGIRVAMPDHQILTRMASGWRPSHYAVGELRPLLDRRDNS